MARILATRYHDISCGHRVVGHETKCKHLHGHNYRVHFSCEAAHGLDNVGRVIDFGVIKLLLCEWLETHWDHRMLLWDADPLCSFLTSLGESHQRVPFNPTAENMAEYLLNVIGPQQLHGTGVVLVHVRIDETAKCSATAMR